MARTPTEIGNEICHHQDRIDELKAELANVPPARLVINGVLGGSYIKFAKFGPSGIDVVVSNRGHSQTVPFFDRDVPALRRWLDYYYPEED